MNQKHFHILPHFHYGVIYTNTPEGYSKIALAIIKKAVKGEIEFWGRIALSLDRKVKEGKLKYETGPELPFN